MPGGDRPLGVVIHLHGLEAEAEAGHMRGISRLAHHAGFASLRLDWLGCGASAAHGGRMYNALRWQDIEAAVGWVSRRLPGRPVYLTGLSLGGAMALRWLAHLGTAARFLVRGAVTISAPVDLGAAASALAERENRVYERWFLASMKRRLAAAAARDPARWKPWSDKGRAARSLAEFDSVVTAPMAGQPDAAAYYARASVKGDVADIRVPTVLVHAEDDPFVPAPQGLSEQITTLIQPAGGHGGFWTAGPVDFGHGIVTDRWAEGAAIRILLGWAASDT